MFLSPSLRKSEYSNLYFFIKISLFVYLFSIILFNVFLVPLSWNFFLNFQLNGFNWIPLFFEAKISEYLIYYINLYSICILNSQFGVFLLVYINSLSKNVLEIKKLRKIFYFLFFFVSTLVTPPDVISQLCFSVVLIFVYETIIILKFTDGFALKF
jgi:Sec-independent protein secretion pathway component TatC